MKWTVFFKGKNNVEGTVTFFYVPVEKNGEVPTLINDFIKKISKLPGMDKTEIRKEN